MKIDEYPTLFQFLGGYFHQDWVVDYSAPEAVIAAFKKEASAESIRSACDELSQAVLLTRQGAEDPQRFLHELGCYYDPAADGLAVPDWLEQVRKKLECQ
jgi:hypothetical protein